MDFLTRPWGIVKEFAAPNKTLCDYDYCLPADLRQRVRAVRRILKVPIKKIRLDRTAKGFHLILIWKARFAPAEIVAIQAMLGSDPRREALNLRRVRCGPMKGPAKKFWNILYSHRL